MRAARGLAAVFDKSAKRIMHVSFGPRHMVMIGGALVVLFILYRTVVMILRHRRMKRRQNIAILKAGVSKLDGDEADRLAEKYKDKQEGRDGVNGESIT
ncbi:MAG: hypothetical protein LBI86_09815 [Treponema sp.]|nr:hypothetical protein [Treponema sp.]